MNVLITSTANLTMSCCRDPIGLFVRISPQRNRLHINIILVIILWKQRDDTERPRRGISTEQQRSITRVSQVDREPRRVVCSDPSIIDLVREFDREVVV
ncbi:hypothetical protein C491_16327 [Natronococcus amylolyticus DSM 10524]|uniref:Uncharacterized protein n=1 Tax=Natronococcus amylolyticus DSM 10524 TaxID=1227497 RepID=L9X0L5_9EURY|nr:hypothetical protein C491_16327 [Natronococcus amylolyticus DSM 10524]